jgi:hypothetical protein
VFYCECSSAGTILNPPIRMRQRVQTTRMQHSWGITAFTRSFRLGLLLVLLIIFAICFGISGGHFKNIPENNDRVSLLPKEKWKYRRLR